MRFSIKSLFVAATVMLLLGAAGYRLDNPYQKTTASVLAAEILPSDSFEQVASHTVEYCEQIEPKECRTFDLSVVAVKEPLADAFNQLRDYIIANEWEHSQAELTDRIKNKDVLFDDLNNLYDATDKQAESFKDRDDALNYFAIALINGGFFDKQAFLHKDRKAMVISILRLEEERKEDRLVYIKQIFSGNDEQAQALDAYLAAHKNATLLGLAVSNK